MQTSSIDVFIGIDVGKSDHWATALDRDGERLFDKALPNDETRLRDLYERLSHHGRVLVVVDQPGACSMVCVSPPGRTDTDDHDG